MAWVPPLFVFLVLHAAFFGDVIGGGRSLSASTYTPGLTARGPVDTPQEVGAPHLLDVEGAAWVDEPGPRLVHAALVAHELPLWSPGEGLGAPLAANLNSGAANPLQLPLNVLPLPWAADIFYLGRLLLLGLFTWAFLRCLAVSPMAAVLGGSIVAYGGYAMAWIVHHPLSAELFLPLMLVGLERGRAGSRGGWVLLVLAAACSLLGGKLQATLLCFGFVSAHALVRRSPTQGGAGAQTAFAAAAGVALGCATAAFLLLPSAELMTRASGLTLGGRSQLAGFTVPWPTLASLATPQLFVPPGQTFRGDVVLTPAIGLVATVLVGVGLAATGTPQRQTARLCGWWALLLLLRNAGVFGTDLVTRVPIVRGISFTKYTFTAVFALAVLAAIGCDAILAGHVTRRRACRAGALALVIVVLLVTCALAHGPLETVAKHLVVPGLLAITLGALAGLWWLRVLGERGVAILLAILVLCELRLLAPWRHPYRLDPYRPPAFVEFLRGASPGRMLAADHLAMPLTSAAAGLRDIRAINVLTPGSYYEFFTRLVSFCERVIYFTADPDLVLAATAPALDLVGVRYIASPGELRFDDVEERLRRQVGREHTARLFAGLTSFRSRGAFLALGPIAAEDGMRFAFTFETPFTLEFVAETEAPDLTWGTLVAGNPAGARLRVVVEGTARDPIRSSLLRAPAERWNDERVPLGPAGTPRRIRIRFTGTSVDGVAARVSFGDLGFGPGAAAEWAIATARAQRHRREVDALRVVFRDADFGVVVYENGNVLPRAFRVRAIEPVASLDAALTRLGDGFDFRTTALVGARDAPTVTAALAPAARNDGGGVDVAHLCDEEAAGAEPACASTATVRSETPNTVTIDTDGPTAALLVLADLAYPGWRASVDGRSATVFTADGLLRGVLVPAGSHVVVFRYLPASLAWGAVVSTLALILLVPYARWAARTRIPVAWP